jgi:hypothetical protein
LSAGRAAQKVAERLVLRNERPSGEDVIGDAHGFPTGRSERTGERRVGALRRRRR